MTSHTLIKHDFHPHQVIASVSALQWNFMGVMKDDQSSKVVCVFPTYRKRESLC